MHKIKIFFVIIIFLAVTSCADTWGSVKRGLTGAKNKSADEFLVKKKDPLIMPPDFENLPSPSDDIEITEDELTSFKKTLGENSSDANDSTTSSSAEESILKKIRKK